MNNTEPLVTDEWKPVRGKKNTKKWCKGKPGREHKPIVELNKNYGFMRFHNVPPCSPAKDNLVNRTRCSHHIVCSECGKELASHPSICPTTGETISF